MRGLCPLPSDNYFNLTYNPSTDHQEDWRRFAHSGRNVTTREAIPAAGGGTVAGYGIRNNHGSPFSTLSDRNSRSWRLRAIRGLAYGHACYWL